MAFGAYVVIYRIYLRSWFATQPFPQAVLPLLLINTFRYMGLAAMVPGQLEPTIPFRALQVIGWGDFANMGTQWFVSVFYAPAFLLSQGYIAYRLVGHLRASRANSISPN